MWWVDLGKCGASRAAGFRLVSCRVPTAFGSGAARVCSPCRWEAGMSTAKIGGNLPPSEGHAHTHTHTQTPEHPPMLVHTSVKLPTGV